MVERFVNLCAGNGPRHFLWLQAYFKMAKMVYAMTASYLYSLHVYACVTAIFADQAWSTTVHWPGSLLPFPASCTWFGLVSEPCLKGILLLPGPSPTSCLLLIVQPGRQAPNWSFQGCVCGGTAAVENIRTQNRYPCVTSQGRHITSEIQG